MKLIGISIIGLISVAVCEFCDLRSADTPQAQNRDSESRAPSDSAAQVVGSETNAETVFKPHDPAESDAESNLRFKAKLLAQGRDFLKAANGYSAQLRKQEAIGGTLLDEQTIELKCRHQPFSVYLLWLSGDTGREVLYVDGKNDGRMIAHDGGWKARLPAFLLEPDGALAMMDTRYPITTAGLLGLTSIMLDIHQDDLRTKNFAACEIDDEQVVDGRACYLFTTTYKSASASPRYRKSETFVDREWNIPISTRHFEWPTDATSTSEQKTDEATLIEAYTFTAIEIRETLTDHDFDRANPEYHFH